MCQKYPGSKENGVVVPSAFRPLFASVPSHLHSPFLFYPFPRLDVITRRDRDAKSLSWRKGRGAGDFERAGSASCEQIRIFHRVESDRDGLDFLGCKPDCFTLAARCASFKKLGYFRKVIRAVDRSDATARLNVSKGTEIVAGLRMRTEHATPSIVVETRMFSER